MDTVGTTPRRKLPRADFAKDCFCHCRDATGKLVHFTEARWQTPKKADEVRQDDMYDNLSSRFDEGRFGSYRRPFYQKYTNKTLLSRLSVEGLIIVLIMICGDDDEDAGDNNIGANGLVLEQGQRSRSVPQWPGLPPQIFKK